MIGDINATQAAGLIGFGAAALASLAAGSGRRERRRTWLVLAGVSALLCVEIVAMARHWLHSQIGQVLRAGGLYEERYWVQGLLFALILTAAFLLARPGRRSNLFTGAGAATAVMACAVCLFAAESVSVHAVDDLLYGNLGPTLLIGWIWLGCGGLVAVIATMTLRRSRRN